MCGGKKAGVIPIDVLYTSNVLHATHKAKQKVCAIRAEGAKIYGMIFPLAL